MSKLLKIFDPLLLAMKLRDSLQTGDNSHIQNYIQDVLTKSLLQSSNTPNHTSTPSSVDVTHINNDINNAINSYLEQMKFNSGIENYSSLQESINNIIQQSISQAFGNYMNLPSNPKAVPTSRKQPTRINKIAENFQDTYNVFEAHDFVIVRINIPDNIHNIKNINARISTNKIFIKWHPSTQTIIIPLPCDVKKDQSTAVVKNHVLEINIPKEQNINSNQIDIQNS